MSRRSAAFHAADRGFVVPRCSSPDFVPALLALCERQAVRLLVPTIDSELGVLAAQRARFEAAGVTVAVSSPEVVAISEDKQRTHAWLVQEGLPTVRQGSVEAVLAQPEQWRFPVIVKPRRGSSSVGVVQVGDARQLAATGRRGDDIVQAVAPGHEYTVDFLADRAGRCRCTVPRRRLEVRGGEVSKGMTVRSEVLEALAWRVCERLPGAYGTLNVQLFLDEASGTVNVIEINARFGGGFPLAWEAGAHLPRWMIEEVLGLPSTASQGAWRDRLVMLRYDSAVFVDEARDEARDEAPDEARRGAVHDAQAAGP
nr:MULTISPECIES: ATP-grasp domain-containing protein [Myxococcaceae]